MQRFGIRWPKPYCAGLVVRGRAWRKHLGPGLVRHTVGAVVGSTRSFGQLEKLEEKNYETEEPEVWVGEAIQYNQ